MPALTSYDRELDTVLKYGLFHEDLKSLANTIADATVSAVRTKSGSDDERYKFSHVGDLYQVLADRLLDEDDPREPIARQHAHRYYDNKTGNDYMLRTVGEAGGNFHLAGYQYYHEPIKLPDGGELHTTVWRHHETGKPVVGLEWRHWGDDQHRIEMHGYFHPDEAMGIVNRLTPEHADRVQQGIAESLTRHRPDFHRF